MLLYKIIVPIISLAFIVYSINQYRLGKNTLIETILWSLIWVAIASIAIFPDFITDKLARIFGIKSNITSDVKSDVTSDVKIDITIDITKQKLFIILLSLH